MDTVAKRSFIALTKQRKNSFASRRKENETKITKSKTTSTKNSCVCLVSTDVHFHKSQKHNHSIIYYVRTSIAYRTAT